MNIKLRLCCTFCFDSFHFACCCKSTTENDGLSQQYHDTGSLIYLLLRSYNYLVHLRPFVDILIPEFYIDQ